MIVPWKPAALAAALLAGRAAAQDYSLSPSTYTDAASGINFSTWATPGQNGRGAFSFGFVLPADALTKDATEYIGRLQCQSASANASQAGWCGVAHGGRMTSNLLLMAWPYRGRVYTSFRWAADYVLPVPYGGDGGDNGTSAAFPPPRLTIVSARANASGYEVIYRCQHCWAWQQGDYNETVHTAGGDPGSALVLGYAQAAKGPANPGCPGSALRYGFHDNGFGQWGAPIANATRAAYADWTALARRPPNAGARPAAASCRAAAATATSAVPAATSAVPTAAPTEAGAQ